MPGKILEEAEFGCGGFNLLLANGEGHGSAVDDKVTMANDFWSEGTLETAEHGLDAGYEFARAEGLGNVIVGSEFESENAVGFATFGRKENHGDHGERGVMTNTATEFEAITTGHHDVEQKQRWTFALGIRHDERGRGKGTDRV